MEFEIGQMFEGRYPPDTALWCTLHSAHIVKNGASDWRIEALSTPTDEEMQSIK
jgi:hypothetical protein